MTDPFSFMACCSVFLMILGAFAPERFGFTGRYVALLSGGICLVLTLFLRGLARAGVPW